MHRALNSHSPLSPSASVCCSLQTYGRPVSKSAESIDGVYQPDLLFQMTVSSSKNVSLHGLQACVHVPAAVGAAATGMRGAALKFFIAVPETRFHMFNQVNLKPDGSAWPAAIAPHHRYK